MSEVLQFALRSVAPRRTRTQVAVRGVPGVTRVTVDGILIVALDGAPCAPITLQPPVRWRPALHPTATEVRAVDARGQAIAHATVDTTVHTWELTCWCGRKRYVKANCRHEVGLCWPCTKHARLLKRRAKAARC